MSFGGTSRQWPLVGGVVVPCKISNAQTNHGILLQLHILLRFISLQLCTENTTGRSSLMFGITDNQTPSVTFI